MVEKTAVIKILGGKSLFVGVGPDDTVSNVLNNQLKNDGVNKLVYNGKQLNGNTRMANIDLNTTIIGLKKKLTNKKMPM